MAEELAGGNSPRNQYYLQSSWDLGRSWELDVTGRYVDSLLSLHVPSYIVGDVRLAWRPNQTLEWAVVGRQLFQSHHAEYGDDPYWSVLTTQVQSEVYAMVTLRR